MAELWPAAATRPWFHERREADGSTTVWLTRHEGACIFLRPEGGCAIHARLGEAAKPAFCREFPFHLVREPTCWTAVVRANCGGFHASCRDGEPVAPLLPALLELPRAYPVQVFEPELVQLLPGIGVPLASWQAAEPALMGLMDAVDEEPEATVAQLRGALYRAIGREAPAPQTASREAALRSLLRALRRAVAPILAAPPAPGQGSDRALLEQASRWIAVALERAAQPISPSAPSAQVWLNLLLRSLVLGKLFARRGGLARALGLLLLDLHLARCATHTVPAQAPEAASLSAVLVPWWSFTANHAIVSVLARSGAELSDLFMHSEGT